MSDAQIMPSRRTYSRKQRKIYANVAGRGYADGWTNEQFLLRQSVKLLEETAELFLAMPWLQRPGKWETLLRVVGNVHRLARELFDDPEQWWPAPVSDALYAGLIREEAIDITVVLACLATALEMIGDNETVHLFDEAIEKSAADTKRGVR